MLYDKDGKYYWKPTNSVNKNKKSSSTTTNKPTPKYVPSTKSFDQQRNLGLIVLAIFVIVIIGGCVAVFQDVTKEKPLTKEQLRLKSLQFCDDFIKEYLKDSSSYRHINSRTEQIATGIIKYSGTNSFGEWVQDSFKCFDP